MVWKHHLWEVNHCISRRTRVVLVDLRNLNQRVQPTSEPNEGEDKCLPFYLVSGKPIQPYSREKLSPSDTGPHQFLSQEIRTSAPRDRRDLLTGRPNYMLLRAKKYAPLAQSPRLTRSDYAVFDSPKFIRKLQWQFQC